MSEDQQTPPPVEVELSRAIVDLIDIDVQHYRNLRLQEAAIEALRGRDVLAWKAGDPLPPEHTQDEPVQGKQVVISGADKYHGAVAEKYDSKREDSTKWKEENRVVAEFLSDLPPETEILDCPCGTGRFLQLYEEKGFRVICMDKSEDMLNQALEKGSVVKNDYVLGDVLDTKLDDNAVDVSLMIRLTRWLNKDERTQALKELQRVTKSRIIFTARVRNHKFAYRYKDIEKALDGWKIARDEPAGEEDYRVLELRAE